MDAADMVAIVPLTKGLHAEVDAEDLALLDVCKKWHAHKGPNDHTHYAIGSIGNKKLKMHRAILGVTDPSIHADHIDGNGLNNQRDNLRLSTPSQNQRNSRKRAGTSSSAYKGVMWCKRDRKWIASTRVNGKVIYAGYFDSEVAAANAYNALALKLFGEFARLNVI